MSDVFVVGDVVTLGAKGLEEYKRCASMWLEGASALTSESRFILRNDHGDWWGIYAEVFKDLVGDAGTDDVTWCVESHHITKVDAQ